MVPLFLDGVGLIGSHGMGVFLGILASIACWKHRSETFTTLDRSQPDSESAEDGEQAVQSEVHKTPTSLNRKRTDDHLSNVYHIFTQPVVVVAALCYIASLGSYVTLSTFITAYFDALSVNGPLNATVLLVATTGRVAGGIVAGRWRIHDWTLITAATATAIVGFGVLAVVHSPLLLVLFPFIAMLAVSFPFGAIYVVATDTTVNEGAALAVVIAAGNLVALLLPAVTGAIRDATGGYSGAFVVLGAINIVAVIGVVSLHNRHLKFI